MAHQRAGLVCRASAPGRRRQLQVPDLRAYSRIVRSDENKPMPATLAMALRAQACGVAVQRVDARLRGHVASKSASSR
jgi:hypothetical protein